MGIIRQPTCYRLRSFDPAHAPRVGASTRIGSFTSLLMRDQRVAKLIRTTALVYCIDYARLVLNVFNDL